MATRDPNLWYTKPDGTNVYYNTPTAPTSLTAGYKMTPSMTVGMTSPKRSLTNVGGYGDNGYYNDPTNSATPKPTINQYGGVDGGYGPPAPKASLLDNGKQATEAVSPNALTTSMTDYFNTLKSRSDTAYSDYQNLQSAIKNRANPYDTNSDAFKAMLKQRQDAVTRAFNGADRAYMSKVAGGHGMGGYAQAGLGNLIGERSRGFADTTNSTYADTMDKYQAFESNRDAQLMGLTGAMNADPSGLGMNLLNYDMNKSRNDLANVGEQQRQNFLNDEHSFWIEQQPYLRQQWQKNLTIIDKQIAEYDAAVKRGDMAAAAQIGAAIAYLANALNGGKGQSNGGLASANFNGGGSTPAEPYKMNTQTAGKPTGAPTYSAPQSGGASWGAPEGEGSVEDHSAEWDLPFGLNLPGFTFQPRKKK